MSPSKVPMPRFLVVCFLATGVPFGVLVGLMRTPSLGVLAGAAFGLGMTATVGLLHVGRARIAGGGVADVHQTEQFLVPGDLDAARTAAARALQSLGIASPREERSEESVVLEGRTRMSFWSWSEVVRIELGPAAGESVPVHVTSRPALRTTIADYGKNLANVRALRAAMVR